jgi:hypothetical protein
MSLKDLIQLQFTKALHDIELLTQEALPEDAIMNNMLLPYSVLSSNTSAKCLHLINDDLNNNSHILLNDKEKEKFRHFLHSFVENDSNFNIVWNMFFEIQDEVLKNTFSINDSNIDVSKKKDFIFYQLFNTYQIYLKEKRKKFLDE